MKKLKTIELDKIKFDEGLYPRSQYSWQTAYDYSESMKTGSKFPPIIVAFYRKGFVLVDGKHRIEACKLQKKKTIQAEVYTGWNYNRIFEEAVRRNIRHGRILSPYEKRLIALRLRAMKYNLKAVSNIIQVPLDKLEDFVGQRLVSATTGESLIEGKSIVKSALKHLAGQKFKGKDFKVIERTQKEMYVRDQVELLKALVDLLNNGLLNLKNPKVKELLDELKDLI